MKTTKQDLFSTRIVFVVLGVLFFLLAFIVTLLKATSEALGKLIALPIGSETGRSLLFLVAVAFVTMCLIQVIRSLVRVRGWFHLRQIENWFRDTERVIERLSEPKQPDEEDSMIETQVARDLADLTRLANIDDTLVFFDAPIEQVCGQISAVAEFLLSELPQPKQDDMPWTGGVPAASSAVKAISSENRRLLAVLTGSSGVMKSGQLLEITWKAPESSTTPAEGGATNSPQSADVRSTLAFQMQRSLDQLQIKVSSRWQKLLRLTAVILSCTICLSATHFSRPVADIKADYPDLAGVATAVMAGIVSGYVSTVFRDMIAIIERRRR